MPKVTEITVLTIDEVPYAVESLSEEVQALVEVYNDWSRKEAEVRDELVRFQAAKETLSRQVINTVREEIAKKDETEADSTDTADSADTADAKSSE